MDTLLEALLRASAPDRTSFRPWIFRPSDPADRARLEDLLKTRPQLVVHDELESQLMELVRAVRPERRFTAEALRTAAKEHLNGVPAHDYGVWVFYPWSDKLVHLLDEVEFIRVRTDRNRNKITAEEQALLATKKVGVIGLSVGQSVCMTLAMERSFGELRIADFDTLDLSNLNRIRSSTAALGHLKTVNVAREIAEIDPFLKVTVYSEGLIGAEDIDRFLTDGGKLDLLVDECDSVGIKILARQRAKDLRIPVLMDTSDRGMIDLERFDLEPDRPIMHGLIAHLDHRKAMEARTQEEKLPFVVPMTGIDTLSKRMKASMLEIEGSVTTWPQLASSVVSGGGHTGHIARRVLLGHRLPSGRWWLDLDDIIGVPDEATSDGSRDLFRTTPPRATDEASFVAESARSSTTDPSVRFEREEIRQLVGSGHQAPSGGNCQPWRFVEHLGTLELHLDTERAKSALDPGYRYAYCTMGMCLENVLLKSRELGLDVEVELFPGSDNSTYIARLELKGRGRTNTSTIDQTLARQIEHRSTNRKASPSDPLDATQGAALVDILTEAFPEGRVHLVEDRQAITKIADWCGRAERIRYLNPACHTDMFVHEMRWTAQHAEETGDGIELDTLELALADRTGLEVAADREAMLFLKEWGAGNGISRMTARNVNASSALLILSVEGFDQRTMIAAGRAIERVWLQATAFGLSVQPISAPMFMGIHGEWDKAAILTDEEHREARLILKELTRSLQITTATPFFMVRLGHSTAPTKRSLRRPLGSVLHSTSDLLS